MAQVTPLRAWSPPAASAAKVASVPYDVVNRAEAEALARGNEDSFLHVTKPEIDLPEDAKPEAVYAEGARALKRLQTRGALVHAQQPGYCVYALTMGEHRQVGVVLGASVRDYNQGVIKKHEHTRPDKEDDRVHHMQALGAQSGKVFLLYKDSPALAELVATSTTRKADIDFTAPDGIGHSLWYVTDPQVVQKITQAFAAAGPMYIADGHHRAAAAARVVATKGEQDGPLLAVAFPQTQAKILAYNRVVHDLNGQSPHDFLEALKHKVQVAKGHPKHVAAKRCGMYLDGSWYTLSWDVAKNTDPVAALDVSVLQDRVLAPLLGIADPRRDKRIDFVGGIRGEQELEKRVDGDWAVAFSMAPTRVDELLAVADAGLVMPPKSTWFEPKLRDGLVVLPL